MMEETPTHFRVQNAFSYPDSFITASFQAQKLYVTLNSSVSWFDTIRRFSPGVHKHPEVVLPINIEYALSLNLKHIFHTELDMSLPMEAFKALERSIRLKWLFRNKPDREFNPKFWVSNPGFQPPRAAPHIEAGLEAGKAELFQQLPPVYPSTLTVPKGLTVRRDHMSIGALKWFMLEQDYLAMITDKNLGIAVIPRSWYHQEMLKHLSDETVYFKRESIPYASIHRSIIELDTHLLPSDQEEFIRLGPYEDVPPKFYGIPKIHKNPWAIRPILPSHKWITAHVSKIVDHHLQPFLSLFPWIVRSTKEFLQKASNINVANKKNLRLLTGDVKSMYTNIPIIGCQKALRKLLSEHPEMISPTLADLVLRMLLLVNTSSWFEYHNQIYWQNKGLAMGTPCAPTVANLYMAIFEAERLARNDKRLLCYYRYIDDIFAIARCYKTPGGTILPTPATYIAYAPGLQVNWKINEFTLPFLDTRVSLHPKSDRIVTSLYEKNLNHFQYIPWNSAHPKNVKRGFVKAELLRFRMICSDQEAFDAAKQQLFHHLRARGYPVKVLQTWFQMVKWSSIRFPLKRAQPDAPLLLPSHYNPIWDTVFTKRIRDAMVSSWENSGKEVPIALKTNVMKSLSRTHSLFDHTRRWNQTLFNIASAEDLPEPQILDSQEDELEFALPRAFTEP